MCEVWYIPGIAHSYPLASSSICAVLTRTLTAATHFQFRATWYQSELMLASHIWENTDSALLRVDSEGTVLMTNEEMDRAVDAPKVCHPV